MKKALLSIAILFALSASAQKKDTTIQITVTLDQYRAILYTIDQNIDSKKVSKDIVEFLNKSAQMVADKPKTDPVLPTKPKQ